MPYWITQTLAGTPAFLWVYVGIGVPWALVLLPRSDWHRRVEVAALAFAVGPGLLTMWMLLLGTLGDLQNAALLRFDLTAIGLAVVTIMGGLLAWRKARRTVSTNPSRSPAVPLMGYEKLLIGLVVAALVVRWIVIAYWPFTAYDSLWVYGFEARLYFLRGMIPHTIGYYPQFVPLQYLFAQLAVGGIDDHAARAGIIFLHIGSILAAYVLGSRLFNRRVGLLLAAAWALYPHTGEWSRAGDLEIPLAFLFTLASAYFLTAWMGGENRRRYAALAGLVFGIGMWTKPTMGAFVWGAALLAVIALVQAVRKAAANQSGHRRRILWENLRDRVEVGVITGLASIPIGGVWYIRNVLYGHAPIDFPPSYWLELALRSGGEFGWLLAALVVLLLFLLIGQRKRPNLLFCLLGAGLIAAGVVPSIVEPRRMDLQEWLLLGSGVVLLGVTLWCYVRAVVSVEGWTIIGRVGAGLALALPYFITWFYSYSYHYRLSFAIVPLLILPTAVILSYWLRAEDGKRMRPLVQGFLSVVLIAAAYPGIISAIYDMNGGWDYLWTDKYPTDDARYRSGNAALMNVVDGFNVWKQEHPGETLIAAAPGIDRLPFFFPGDDIRVNNPPTQLAQVEDIDYFVWGAPETIGTYQGIHASNNQVIGALGRIDLGRRAWGMDDGIFRYDVYELNAALRFAPKPPNQPAADDVVFGGFARYLGADFGGLDLWPGRPLYITLYWQVLEHTDADYSIYIHLRDAEGNLIANWDAPVALTSTGYYSTQFWEPGEIIQDQRILRLPDGFTQIGEGYQFWIGLYQPPDARVPMTINGEPANDGYRIRDDIGLLAEAPSS
ncbi:MAG: glycosyltransferase family 39 protein [Anaerolineae bacterium]